MAEAGQDFIAAGLGQRATLQREVGDPPGRAAKLHHLERRETSRIDRPATTIARAFLQLFDKEVELPRKFWMALDFNAEQTKGVYVSYDTSTKGKYSRVGLPGDNEEPKETDFKGDWMVQLLLAKPEK